MAEEEFKSALKTTDGSSKSEAAFLLGILNVATYGDDLAALRWFSLAAKEDPDNADAWNNAAVCGYLANRTTAIAENFAHALERHTQRQLVGDNLSLVVADGKINRRHMEKLILVYKDCVTRWKLEERHAEALASRPRMFDSSQANDEAADEPRILCKLSLEYPETVIRHKTRLIFY